MSTFGSSPQARGTHGTLKYFYSVSRFIPAGAGNTRLLFASGSFAAVHPRRRGEHNH
uniref:Uncharacterized protein n=1 Tax=mine drainage metagenome TaxID=410659 RepID=E6QU52_9ZZZZ